MGPMALFDDDSTFECVICGKTFNNIGGAEQHAKDRHKDDIVEEEWGHYFNEE